MMSQHFHINLLELFANFMDIVNMNSDLKNMFQLIKLLKAQKSKDRLRTISTTKPLDSPTHHQIKVLIPFGSPEAGFAKQ